MRKILRGLSVLGLVSVLGQNGWSQFPSLRTTDTRTSTPEAIMTDRKEWGVDVDLGGSFNRGNTNVDYLSTGFDVFKAWSPSTLYLSGGSIYNRFNGIQVLNQGTLTARYDYAVAGSWKIFVFNTNAYNEFTQLNYRETSGIGPWYDFTVGPTKHGVSLAAAQEYENYRGGVYHRTGRISFRDISRFPISNAAQITTDFFYIPKADEFGNYRLFGEIALQTMIWKKYLGLKLSWTDDYNNRPQPGVKPNDTLWLTSFSFHFGV